MLSGFGWLGLHRFYMNKKKTATVWVFTGGFFGIGAVADLFAMKWLIKRHNMIEKIKQLQKELEATKAWKEKLAEAQKYEEAAYNRDKENLLTAEIEKLRARLRTTSL